jgi:hypothetical protein
MESHQKI